jgi:hypothetical protein
MKMYLDFPPSFAPKYDGYRTKSYFELNTKKEEIIKFLLENWKTPNYTNEKLSIIIAPVIPDSKILNDLRNILINSVISAFYEKYKQDLNLEIEIEIEDVEAKKILELLINENFDNIIFRRTANFSTPYGFL